MKQILQILTPLLISWLLCCCTPSNDIVFDALSLVNKSPTEVAEILGQPDTIFQRTFFGKQYFIQYYNEYGVEVRHYQGKVRGVIVNEPYPLEFKPETITKFGIDYVEPTKYDSLSTIVWKNIEGFKVVNFYLRGVKKPDSIEHSYHIYFNMDTASVAQ
ncbi:hypothetical protein [Tunicatimonas pelagia]|uniref:hypothetical protein n=1 Tax=Tunicatimonas pelagia TaxID=931531 RepID=UPI002664EC04|nr:hypothetical protein [Tunicatimonas pelagia]WKN42034.1 hypothetical protein P0M28_23635 [Tunicatimonas pelagia]